MLDRNDVVDYVASLTDTELASVLEAARPDESAGAAGAAGAAEADRRFGSVR